MAIIEPNLNATLMRNQMETKNELSAKGSLYVGTGDTTSVTYIGTDGATATTDVPVTTHIAPNVNEDDGKILIVDSKEDTGWKIDKIGNDNITNGTITGDKLAENFTYNTSDTGSFCLQDSSNNSTPRLSFVESNNRASVALQADLKSQELDGKSFTLTVPNEDGTLATKEQIENGDIVAKTATTSSYASTANATSIGGKPLTDIFSSDGITAKKSVVAQTTDFTNAKWNLGSSEIEVRDSALYEVRVNGIFLVVGGGVSTNQGRAFDIITTNSSEYTQSTILQYFDVYEARISSDESTSYLRVSKTRYEAKVLGGYVFWQLDSRTQITDFRYRRIA